MCLVKDSQTVQEADTRLQSIECQCSQSGRWLAKMERMFKARLFVALVVSGASVAAGCSKNSTSTTTSPTPTAAAATITESFTAALAVGGGVFYSFNFAAYGNVAVTLTGATGGGLADGQTVGLGIGRPSGTSCSAATSVAAMPSDTPQVTGTYGPGIYCVSVSDTGSLTDKVTVAVTVNHS